MFRVQRHDLGPRRAMQRRPAPLRSRHPGHWLAPREVPVAAHALALTAGVALTILGIYLMRRRRRAWGFALATLLIAGRSTC